MEEEESEEAEETVEQEEEKVEEEAVPRARRVTAAPAPGVEELWFTGGRVERRLSESGSMKFRNFQLRTLVFSNVSGAGLR